MHMAVTVATCHLSHSRKDRVTMFPATCGAHSVGKIWGLRLDLCQAALDGVWLVSTLNAVLFLIPQSML
jgi:hypothetical protein